MKHLVHILLLSALMMLSLTACDSVFDIHPYDTRVEGATDLNAKNIKLIEERCLDKDTMHIAVISDSHQWYKDLEAEIADINRRDSIDFVIHLGDLTDFGSTLEYSLARERLLKLRKPFVVMQGNHDCLGTGNEVYAKMFGNNDFSFIAGRVKFIMINTNAIETTTLSLCPISTSSKLRPLATLRSSTVVWLVCMLRHIASSLIIMCSSLSTIML